MIDKIKHIVKNNKTSIHILKNDECLRQFIEQYSNIDGLSFQAKVYMIVHNMAEPPKCKNANCHKYVTKCQSINVGFQMYCSNECSCKDIKRRNKARETFLMNNGKEQNPEGYERLTKKRQFTNFRRHGSTKNMNQFSTESGREHYKQVCQKKWGVDHYSKTNEFIQKSMNTQESKYGVKIANQFNNDSMMEKYKRTCEEKYEGKHPRQCSWVEDKRKQTCQEKWGVTSFSQTNEFMKKCSKKIQYDGIWFHTKPEIELYKYCRMNDIQVEYNPSISFEYEYDGIKHIYHPDFLINGKLYEVKGDHFFKINESGVEEMFNPFRDGKWSDDEYNQKCKQYEAKHQCMIDNGVTIVKSSRIMNGDFSFLQD